MPSQHIGELYPGRVKEVLEETITEIRYGLVEIVGLACINLRCKVAVRALDLGIDPVASCVGKAGSLIKEVVEGVEADEIDVFEWDGKPSQLIANSLGRHLEIIYVKIYPGGKFAEVKVPDNQIGVALGKQRMNIDLAKLVTGYRIAVKGDIPNLIIPTRASTRRGRSVSFGITSGGLPSLGKRR